MSGRFEAAAYGGVLDVLLETGWDYWTYEDQPADLIDELHVKLTKRALARRSAAQKAKRKSGR